MHVCWMKQNNGTYKERTPCIFETDNVLVRFLSEKAQIAQNGSFCRI